MTLADVARACVPSPSAASSSEESSFDDFASATFDRLRALRDGARDLEPARPRQRIPNDRDDGSPRAAPLVEEVSSSSSSAPTRTSSALALLACAAHGARAAGDVPRWSNARLRALADSTYDDGFKARGPDAVIDSFLEAHSWEEPPSKASFGADAASDALAAEIAARQLSWCLERDELYRGSRTRDVVAVAMPRVLRALDYPSEAVRASGAMSARALSTRATGFDWRAGPLGRRVARRVSVRLDRRDPGGLAARLGRRVRVDGRRREGRGNRGVSQDVRASHRLRALCAGRRRRTPRRCSPRFRDLIRDAKACVAVHLDRLLPAFVRVHAIAQGRRRRRRGVARRARRRKRLAARARALRVDVAAREARVRRSGRSIGGELR